MTEKQKYAIKLAISTMYKYFGRHYNTVYENRKTGVTVRYDEAISILSDMVRDNDNKPTNADRIRNMSDEELAELITNMDFDCAKYCDSFASGCAFSCNKKYSELALKWLQSEAE